MYHIFFIHSSVEWSFRLFPGSGYDKQCQNLECNEILSFKFLYFSQSYVCQDILFITANQHYVTMSDKQATPLSCWLKDCHVDNEITCGCIGNGKDVLLYHNFDHKWVCPELWLSKMNFTDTLSEATQANSSSSVTWSGMGNTVQTLLYVTEPCLLWI